MIAVAVMTAAWKYTPLAQLADPDVIIKAAREFGSRPWAPIVVMLAYTPACVTMFPRPLITLFAIVAFGAWAGFGYALAGIVIAALATYLGGRLAGRARVRRLAGPKLNRVSEILRKRGLLAMTAVRLVPVAPFAVIGLVAGAIRVRVWHVALGTAIGNAPGTLATTVFGDQLQAALRDPSTINYWLVGAVLLLFAVAILLFRRWFFGRSHESEGSAPARASHA
jgi:uncharacterized membrane protein YdjX (TVP38/TMEM64 family)